MAMRLGYDAELLGRVCRSFARRVSQSLRGRVKREHRLDTVARLHPGIVTIIQRFRSDLGVYVHLHCLVTDGAFEESDNDEAPQFRGLSTPSDSDLVDVLRRLADDLQASADDDIDIDPGIAACVQLALSSPAASTPLAVAPPALNVHALGMNLHAPCIGYPTGAFDSTSHDVTASCTCVPSSSSPSSSPSFLRPVFT